MKKYVVVPAVGLALFSWVFSCPRFVEFYPDPKDVSDREGEYVEIRMDDFQAESLFVQFESKESLSFAWPKAERFVLVHDSVQCPVRSEPQEAPLVLSQEAPQASVACGSLGKISLPNSRETVWKVWAGTCMDSVTVPHPKPGKAIQRVGLTDRWEFVDAATASSVGIDAADSLLESRVLVNGVSVLRVTEVHHCPEEPMPEWVELYNAGMNSLPLDVFRFCDRGGALGGVGDSIRPFQAVLVSKDTTSLRAALEIPEIRMVQVSLGFLNNNEGALRLCFRDRVIDSVSWNKSTVACPSGFNPLSGRREFTPGFLPKSARNVSRAGGVNQDAFNQDAAKTPVEYKLSSRVISKKGSPLRVRVESEQNVVLSLLDSAGRRVWKSVVPAMANEWVKVPAQEYLGIGAGFVSLSVGDFENVVGILVRP
ncbi:lamin tail domain-containing protein [Fibrobacter succinogenes]|uniref:lamin tail domain-containing protein n=1 Tax=Fibrobacter succinogenes TaxID=833 RepID=UPI00156A469B|nr:lamin tail domain-containing protein [Fibrobacter succinogenes]